MYFQHFCVSVQGLSTVIEVCKAGHVCAVDHLALCSVPRSTLRAMGIPPHWCCLKRFWNRLIPWFTETLNTMFGSDPNGVSNRRLLQSCSFCKLCEVKPSWRTDARGSLVYLNWQHITASVFTDQQKQDFSIAAGMQYSIGDKCKVSNIEL